MAANLAADPAYIIPDNPTYNPTMRALKTTDPSNAETIFNPLFLQIISNIHAVKQLGDTHSPLTHNHDALYDSKGAADAVGVLVSKQDEALTDVLADLTQLTFDLAVQGLINTQGMKHVIVDRIEAVGDVLLVSGRFDGTHKKVYI